MFSFKTVGHDVEFHIKNQDGVLVPWHDMPNIEPMKGMIIHPDNVLAEITAPPSTMDTFVEDVNRQREAIEKTLMDMGGYIPQWGLIEAEYADIENEEAAQRIGCEPFRNIYVKEALQPTPYPDNKRFAGGHVHLGFDVSTVPPEFVVERLDSLLKASDKPCEARDAFYGMKGSYRSKGYGIEYRSLSNSWFTQPEVIVQSLKFLEEEINEIIANAA